MTKNQAEFVKGVHELTQAVISCIDKHFGLKPGTEPDSTRDRMVVTALIDIASRISFQDGSELGAIQLLVNTIVHQYREDENHTGHGCPDDPKKQPSA